MPRCLRLRRDGGATRISRIIVTSENARSRMQQLRAGRCATNLRRLDAQPPRERQCQRGPDLPSGDELVRVRPPAPKSGTDSALQRPSPLQDPRSQVAPSFCMQTRPLRARGGDGIPESLLRKLRRQDRVFVRIPLISLPLALGRQRAPKHVRGGQDREPCASTRAECLLPSL